VTAHLATRVMKARRPGTCPLCRQAVTVGQQIGRTPAGWCHTECIIGKAKDKHVAEQLTLDFSGARPLSEVLEQRRIVRAQRDASLRQAATTDAAMAAKPAAVRESLRALVGEESFRGIMDRYA
jgi:hypothetical protein